MHGTLSRWSPYDWKQFDALSPLVRTMATIGGAPYHPYGLGKMKSDAERCDAIVKCWDIFGRPVSAPANTSRHLPPAKQKALEARSRRALRLLAR